MIRGRQRAGVVVRGAFVAATVGLLIAGWMSYDDMARRRAAEAQLRQLAEAKTAIPSPADLSEGGGVPGGDSATAYPDTPRFVDVTQAAGIDFVHETLHVEDDVYRMTGGAAAGDYDGDGWIDLFVGQTLGPPLLYRNLGPDPETGEVRFESVADAAGIREPAHGSNAAVWADLNNNGRLDLFVATANQPRYYLYINQGDGTFTEEAIERGADAANKVPRFSYGVAAGDYDNDGYVDLIVSEWLFKHQASELSGLRLLRNLGSENPARFVDETATAGLRMPIGGPSGTVVEEFKPVSFAPRFCDLDGDGVLDLAVTSDYGTSRLFWGNGDGTFTDGTVSAGVGTGTNEMGSAIADYDGDGRLDWFVTSIDHGHGVEEEGNRLYRNERGRRFSDRTRAAGVADAGWGWGAAFFDYDNDGHLDVIATNGFPSLDEFFSRFTAFPTQLWRNNGEGGAGTTFINVGKSSGIADDLSGKGLLVFDYDNDGDLDVFIVNNGSAAHQETGAGRQGERALTVEQLGMPVLYRNNGGNRNHWLKVRTIGSISNRGGLGALVTVTDGRLGRPLVSEINAGSHFLGQSPAEAHFGLGRHVPDAVERVAIRWPSGITQEFSNVPVNDTLLAVERVESPPADPPAVVARSAEPPDVRRRPRESSRSRERQGVRTAHVAAYDAAVNDAPRTDAVIEWNRTLCRLVRETNKFDLVTRTGGDKPPEASREMAMVHLAIFDAVDSFDRKWKPYIEHVPVPAGASREAAVAGAASDVMTYLYGRQSTIVSRTNTQLADLRAAGVSERSIADGLAVGKAAARRIIEAREDDGADAVVPWPDSDEPGEYRTDRWTPDAESPPSAPQWPKVEPFVMTSPSQFRQPGPPAIGSEEYRQDLAEVEKYGDRRRYDPKRYPNGKLPREIQRELATAFFWAEKGLNPNSAKNNHGTVTPVGHWNEIASAVSLEKRLSLEENARLFALLNVTLADAAIAAWDMKYHYNLWRPIHAILVPAGKSGADDWLPLIPTSMHPEYPSGHSTFSGAAAEVLARYFGADEVAFTCTGDDALIDPLTGEREERTFRSFRKAAEEAGRSRIFGGIHYQFSNDDGLKAGKELGGYVFENALTARQAEAP
ncbi:MAG: FG-GAP-like repeat-containing protein [Planctomycetaceae bacterium]